MRAGWCRALLAVAGTAAALCGRPSTTTSTIPTPPPATAAQAAMVASRTRPGVVMTSGTGDTPLIATCRVPAHAARPWQANESTPARRATQDGDNRTGHTARPRHQPMLPARRLSHRQRRRADQPSAAIPRAASRSVPPATVLEPVKVSGGQRDPDQLGVRPWLRGAGRSVADLLHEVEAVKQRLQLQPGGREPPSRRLESPSWRCPCRGRSSAFQPCRADCSRCR